MFSNIILSLRLPMRKAPTLREVLEGCPLKWTACGYFVPKSSWGSKHMLNPLVLKSLILIPKPNLKP